MKLDKDFKNEVDKEFNESWYVAKKMIAKILVVCVVISVISAIGGVGYKMFKTNTDRMIFKQSVTYNEGVLDDLAKYKLEIIQSETEVEKKAIANMVVDRFANYDETKIESYDLKQFLKDCRNLNVEDY